MKKLFSRNFGFTKITLQIYKGIAFGYAYVEGVQYVLFGPFSIEIERFKSHKQWCEEENRLHKVTAYMEHE